MGERSEQQAGHSEMANLHRNLNLNLDHNLDHPHNLMSFSLARDTPVIKVSCKSVRSELNPDHPQKLTGCSLV